VHFRDGRIERDELNPHPAALGRIAPAHAMGSDAEQATAGAPT